MIGAIPTRLSAPWVLAAWLGLAAVAQAQDRAYIQDLRREGWDLASTPAARPQLRAKFRDALLLAQRIEATDLQVLCLVDLVVTMQDRKSAPALRTAILEEGLRLATQLGRRDLEIRAARRMPGENARHLKILHDAVTASRDLGSLEYLWTSSKPGTETRKVLEEAMRIIDRWVEAGLRSRFKRPENPLPAFDELGKRAQELGFERTRLALLEAAADYDPARCPAMLEAARALGDRRAIAKALLGLAKNLDGALRIAQRIGDFPLQLAILKALARQQAERPWKRLAEQTTEAYRLELIDQAERARESAWFGDPLLVPGLRRFAADPTVAPLPAQLDDPAPLPTPDSEDYVAALREALADDVARPSAAFLADFAGRPEAFEPLVDALKKKGSNPWTQILAFESLATRGVRRRLALLATHPNWAVRESAAAALLRLGIDGVERQVALALAFYATDSSRIYLRAAMAKLGHPRGFETLARDAANRNRTRQLHAAAARAAIGFATPIMKLHELADSDVNKRTLGRVLARTPHSWGRSLVYKASGAEAMRTAALRGYSGRYVERLGGGILAKLWALPRSPKEAVGRGLGNAYSLEPGKREDPVTRKIRVWIAKNAGMGMAGLDTGDPKPAAGKETPSVSEQKGKGAALLEKLAKAERRTRRQPFRGGRRDLVLLDSDPAGFAACRIRIRLRKARLIDNTLQIPFRWSHKITARSNGGLSGAFYKSYVMASAAGDLFKGVDARIPGQSQPLPTSGSAGPEGWSILSVTLPREIVGDGLGESRGVGVERLKRARLRFRFDFNGNKGSVIYPVPYFPPSSAKQPDLVPVRLMVAPPVPTIGAETAITATIRNAGRTIERGGISSVRFQVKNPQGEKGWRTLDVRVFDSTGWRAGELRTFRVRPKFVKDYYMNKYSYTWTPAVGNSTLAVVVDPDGAVEEGNEKNNRLERPVLLELPKNEARRLAVEELLAVFGPAVRAMREAGTIEELDRAFGTASSALGGTKVQSVEVLLAWRHTYAAFKIHEARIRAREATERLQRAVADGSVTRALWLSTRRRLARAKRNLLESGVPVRIETIDKVRNVTVTAANLVAAQGELAEIGHYFGRGDAGETPDEVGKTLRELDGAATLYRYAQARAKGEEADVGDVMDAASSLVDVTGATVPGMSNLHKALLKAELEYVDKGMRKNAAALDALTRVMDGEEGAQAALQAAAREAGDHAKAGPFTKEALKEMAIGWAKDIPVLGQFVDAITSQK